MDKVIELKENISFQGFSVDTLIAHKEEINYLRNRISHNKTMLNSNVNYNINGLIASFCDVVPSSYKAGFKLDINECRHSLNLPNKLIITL
jgi:hypothetical protein